VRGTAATLYLDRLNPNRSYSDRVVFASIPVGSGEV
jgi:hypothetical protein